MQQQSMQQPGFETFVRNDLKEVARTSEMISAFWAEHCLPADGEFDATLALEEILSNVIRHGCQPGCDYDIRVRFSLDSSEEPSAYELEIIDNAKPYNPLLAPAPDLDAPIEQRRPGGLGVFLVKKMADDLRYEYCDGHNVLVFRKRLQAEES